MRYSRNYYTSIKELPVYNWWQMHEGNNFSFMLKNDAKINEKLAIKYFKECQKEFYVEFGLDDKFKEYLKKSIELELLNIQVAKGDKSQQIFAEVCKIELEEMTLELQKKVYNHGIMHVEKYMGFRLDTKTISTYEFYAYVKQIEEDIKHMKTT